MIIIILDEWLEKNINLVKDLINRIELYSPIKIKENRPPEYSVLKPDTSSDSPSEKSKGDRFVSAKHDTNQQIKRGVKAHLIFEYAEIIMSESYLIIIHVTAKIAIIMIISYEIAWDEERYLPSNLYLEFPDHPLTSKK